MSVRDVILAVNPTDAPDFSVDVDMQSFENENDPNWSLGYYIFIEELYEHFLEGRMTAEPDWASKV